MGSTVYANGLAVATSTSGHWAHSVPFDLRLVGYKQETPLPNNVPSTDIFAAYPGSTRFASGLIWVDGTKAGPKSQPIDTWPGAVIKSAINSYATTKAGSGSNNVYVEARRVYCLTHLTEQNEGNSSGILDDKPGVVEGANAGDGAATQGGLVDPNSNTGSKGGDKGETGKKDGSDTVQNPPQPGPLPAGECTLQLATVTDAGVATASGATRVQSAEQGDTAYLQMASEAYGKAIFEAKVDKPCNAQHPLWDIEGKQYKQLKVEQSVSSGASLLGRALGSITGLIDLPRVAMQAPRTYTGTISTHRGTKRRIVQVFPGDKAKHEIKTDGKPWDRLQRALTFNGKLPGVTLTIKVFQAGVALEAQWTPASDWKCPLILSFQINGVVFSGEMFKYWDLTILTALPVVGQALAVAYAANAAAEAWNKSSDCWFLESLGLSDVKMPVVPLPQAYVRMKVEVKATIFAKYKKLHAATPFVPESEKSLTFVPGDDFSVTLGLELGIGLSVGRYGEGIFACGGEVFAKTSFGGRHVPGKIQIILGEVTLQGKLWVTYDLLSWLPSKWASKKDTINNTMKALFGITLKDKKELVSPPFKVTTGTAVCAEWEIP